MGVSTIVHHWDFGIACKNEVAVHAMNREVRGDSQLSRRETLCYNCAAVDASCSGGTAGSVSMFVDVWRRREGVCTAREDVCW